jgi:ferredoxin-thioredoxin reductase catalytic chain
MMEDVELLFKTLQKIQEPKGYFFNQDQAKTFDLLAGLLMNKKRYGYMACPCRLAANNRDQDRDIVCPCVYREADVAEYGSCYCNLYVSQAWNEGAVVHRYVPERRPLEKMGF